VYGLQREKLLNNQKQKEDHRTIGEEEILSSMPPAQGASGDEIAARNHLSCFPRWVWKYHIGKIAASATAALLQFFGWSFDEVQASSSNW
jgi:hypothetical protein